MMHLDEAYSTDTLWPAAENGLWTGYQQWKNGGVEFVDAMRSALEAALRPFVDPSYPLVVAPFIRSILKAAPGGLTPYEDQALLRIRFERSTLEALDQDTLDDRALRRLCHKQAAIIVHEMVHYNQFLHQPNRSVKGVNSRVAATPRNAPTDDERIEYLSKTIEIEAYAAEAANELRTQAQMSKRSPVDVLRNPKEWQSDVMTIVSNYRRVGQQHPEVWQRFIKRLIWYVNQQPVAAG